MVRPQFVYFDLGNVLVYFDHGRAVRQMSELTGESEERMRKLLFESGLEDRYETGTVTTAEYRSMIEDAIGRPLDDAHVMEAVGDIFWENRSILPVLHRIKGLGIRLGLLSNTCPAHWDWIVRQEYETVHGWFEHHVLSYEVKAMKPSPAIYHHAQELAGVEASSIFFTDDRQDNIEGAIEVGWMAFRYTDADALQRHVESWS